ncbi:SH3 domain-containing protein [Cereibacter changlensis]|uniref:SH3 domain-containing protein n=1 Tax=Cereibacter changlensis TaxID=402884 RepID=A0A4U0YZB9_9RHOB|nr:SH3 domain-containing protein [Cereibacter changlensis]TKA98280.1 SH3 domain-containing protein [Cereibacter changlensis]
MRNAVLAALAAVLLSVAGAQAGPTGYHEVFGVEEDDLLKLRSGPGLEYPVIVGIPNGTLLRVGDCQQNRGTRWCRVTLKEARALKGFVSAAYLRTHLSQR